MKLDKSALQQMRDEHEAFSGFSTTRNLIAADQRALIINWPWYDLKYAIRRIKGTVNMRLVDDWNTLNQVKYVLDIDGELFWIGVFDRNDLIEDSDLGLRAAMDAIDRYVDSKLEGLDWSEYFD